MQHAAGLTRLASLIVPLLAMSACSSLDDDVFPAVAPEPHVSFDRTAPDSLAELDAEVILVGGNRDRRVELSTAELVELAAPHLTIRLAADLAGFDGLVREDEEVPVPLVNLATTAENLAPLCGSRPFGLRVGLRMLDEPGTQNFSPPEPVDVTCR